MTETIVMIHGMWGGSWSLENYKRYFEEKGYTCHTPTLRYHDIDPKEEPPPGLGTTSLLDYVRDLEEYIRGLDDKPILMGHSMGALLAQILSERDLAKSLVLLTPAPPGGIVALKFSVIKSFLDIIKQWGFWREPHRLSFEAAAYSCMHLLSLEEQKTVYEKFVYESGRAAAEIGFWMFDLKRAACVDETKVTCPVLVIAGTQDRITPASGVRKTAEKYNADYKAYDNHAHWVIGEPDWEEIAEDVADWLNQNEAA